MSCTVLGHALVIKQVIAAKSYWNGVSHFIPTFCRLDIVLKKNFAF